jgi:hypothetical protein
MAWLINIFASLGSSSPMVIGMFATLVLVAIMVLIVVISAVMAYLRTKDD